MKIFPVPANPNADKTDRRNTILLRAASTAGSLAVAAVSFKVLSELPPLDGAKEPLSITAMLGSVCSLLPVTAELCERYGRRGRGRGRGDDDAPDVEPPSGPRFGVDIDVLMREIEATLQKEPERPRELTTV